MGLESSSSQGAGPVVALQGVLWAGSARGSFGAECRSKRGWAVAYTIESTACSSHVIQAQKQAMLEGISPRLPWAQPSDTYLLCRDVCTCEFERPGNLHHDSQLALLCAVFPATLRAPEAGTLCSSLLLDLLELVVTAPFASTSAL